MVSAFTSLSAVGLAVLAATTTTVDAHGTLSKPQLKFTGSGYGGNFATTVPMNSLTPQAGDKFTNYPDWSANAAAFGRAFKASKYKSLKEFLMEKQTFNEGRDNMPRTMECGFTDPTGGPVVALPDQLEWYGGKMNHDGPCEVWCDDEVVLPFTANCAVTYPQGKFTYAKDKCVGKKRLTMYWMSTLLQWQVYIQCAKIGEGGSAASNNANKTPAATTKAPTPAAPTSTKAATTPTATKAATPATTAPAVAGEANTKPSSGSAGKTGCKRKLRDD